MNELLMQCAERGVREVIAVVADPGEPGSAALHRRAGFTEMGRLHGAGVKFGLRLDTVLMQRSLVTPHAPG